MTEPTDAELAEVYKAANGEDTGKAQPLTTKRIFRAMRAAIAKWGTPPAVAGEPVAYLHDDGYWTTAKTNAGRSLNDRLLFAGSPKVAVYTTQQPTQAQAGAVPRDVTPPEDAMLRNAARRSSKLIAKGGQHAE